MSSGDDPVVIDMSPWGNASCTSMAMGRIDLGCLPPHSEVSGPSRTFVSSSPPDDLLFSSRTPAAVAGEREHHRATCEN
ncbi:hypothetical protein BRADI_5g01033v3 [Brachypodium distachyon]|uniref:Uncharacterized protein n=1 Tax=Brachypodium distachyon TaxID=15368 RepID=A0A2K2CER0_BRADI|nr:hypothetical protein BRADI_5g01033v3 [Brachypodium distachyon]